MFPLAFLAVFVLIGTFIGVFTLRLAIASYSQIRRSLFDRPNSSRTREIREPNYDNSTLIVVLAYIMFGATAFVAALIVTVVGRKLKWDESDRLLIAGIAAVCFGFFARLFVIKGGLRISMSQALGIQFFEIVYTALLALLVVFIGAKLID